MPEGRKPRKGEKVSEDRGYSMREDAGRLGPVSRKMPETAVDDTSRSRKTGGPVCG